MEETVEVKRGAPQLQVMIAAYGADGMRRLAEGAHPRVEGVEYLVSWQLPDADLPVPDSIAGRPDFIVKIFKTRGLSVNRNHLLDMATAPLLLISDDDVSYTGEGLRGVIDSFAKHRRCDVLTFRYTTDCPEKVFPDTETPLDALPKGYYTGSIEIAFRRGGKAKGVRFNTHFGVNGDFCAGEEDLFLDTLFRRGAKGMYIPLTLCHHPGPTTGVYAGKVPLVQAKGAVFLALHPRLWPLYMLRHALREPPGERTAYCRLWIKGVLKARRLKVFR